MKVRVYLRAFWPLYLLAMLATSLAVEISGRGIAVFSDQRFEVTKHVIIIDAGHGGEDGGAISCTGMAESQINLQIALRLEDLLHLLGFDTCMIRRTDVSVYTQGNSLSEKKVSDLRQRVRIVNEMEGAFLVSIHQNAFPDSQYYGAQVFYNRDAVAKQLAVELQQSFQINLNPASNRKSKPADGIYLMQKIEKPGILVECGFLSNPQEEARLRQSAYQKKLCCVIASTLSLHLDWQTNG